MAYPYGGPGYPPSGPGYPPGGPGYPPARAGYPPDAGYPPTGGYPPAPGGYPPAQGGYPPAQGGYPPAPGGYAPAPVGGYPQHGGYPPTTGGYPAPGGYPPTTAGYGAPPAGGYPPPIGGYSSGPPPPGVNPGFGAPPTGAQPYGGHQQPPQQSYAMHQQPHAQPAGHSQPPPAHVQPQHQPAAPTSHGQTPQRPPPPSKAVGSAPPTSQMASMSLNQKSLKYGNPTVKPISPFDAEADCELLRKAMRGMGTNEQALIDIIAQRSNTQRVEIRKRYKTMFGKDLMNDLKSELSGNLEGCLLALMEPSSLYDAKCLRRAMRGAGTDEETLIDILCTRTNSEILEIKRSYTEYYKRDLEKDCVSETSGHFKRLLVSMCQANRDESTTVDLAKAQKEAQDLFQAGEKKWGTDESRFNVVLASRSFVQLRATFDEYIKISQRDILNSIDREMSGDLRAGFKCIVQCARNPAEYFADRLWKSMKGVGTNDDLLIRIIVSRSEVDLVEIKQAFLQKYHKTVYKMIEGDCSGDYKKLLFSIVGRN